MKMIDLKLSDPNWALKEVLRFTSIVCLDNDTIYPDGWHEDGYPHPSVANVRTAADALAKLADAYEVEL
jgi:hypothetical protein